MFSVPTLKGSFFYSSRHIFTEYQEFNVSYDSYNSVTAPPIFYHSTYGHFLRDTVSMFFFIPHEIAKTSYFAISTDSYAIKDVQSILEASGIDESRLLYIRPKTFYHCKNLYIAYSFSQSAYGFAFLPKFKHTILNYYKIKSVPLNYVLHQRRSSKRSIINFEEVKNFVKMNFPVYNWVHFPDIFDTFERTVREFSRIKFYFSGTGSSMMNIIFMKQDTGAVYYIFNFYDPPVLLISNIFRIWTKCFKIYDHNHFQSNCVFTKELLDKLKFTMIDVMYSMNNSRWKDSDQCYNLYEVTRNFYIDALDVINSNIINYTLQKVNCSF